MNTLFKSAFGSAVFFYQYWARIATNQVAASGNSPIEIKCASVHQVARTIPQGPGERQEGPVCNSMDCNPPDSSVHGISQARILECLAISFSKGSSRLKEDLRIKPASPTLAGRFFITELPGNPLIGKRTHQKGKKILLHSQQSHKCMISLQKKKGKKDNVLVNLSMPLV